MSPSTLRAVPSSPEAVFVSGVPARLVMTCEEVAAALGLSVVAARRFLSGPLRKLTRRVGKRRVIARAALTRWLEDGGGR